MFRGRHNGGGGGQELASRDPFGNDSLIDSFGAFGNMHRVMNTMMQDMNTRMVRQLLYFQHYIRIVYQFLSNAL